MIFANLEPVGAPIIRSWCTAGNQVVCVVASSYCRRRLKRDARYGIIAPQWSWTRALRKHAPKAKVEFIDDDGAWDAIDKLISDLRPDLLISAMFMKKIPDRIIERFPLRGVNLHPAVLPEFAGSQPLQHLVLTQKYGEFGGVTLHELSNRFDAGPIIAINRIDRNAWQNPDTLRAALSGAFASLVANSLPAWCAGEIEAVVQDLGRRNWAGSFSGPIRAGQDWTFEKLEMCARYLWRRPGLVIVEDDREFRVGPIVTKVGERAGLPAQANGSKLIIDLSNARVEARYPNALVKPFSKLRRKVGWWATIPLPPDGTYRP